MVFLQSAAVLGRLFIATDEIANRPVGLFAKQKQHVGVEQIHGHQAQTDPAHGA